MDNAIKKLYVILSSGEPKYAYDNECDANTKLQYLYDREREEIEAEEGYEGKQLEDVLLAGFECEIEVVRPDNELWDTCYEIYQNMDDEEDDEFDDEDEEDEHL